MNGSPRPLGPPSDHGSLTERVYKRLAADIIEGRLPPGSQLLETTLAKELGVSRTPVREALRVLISEGLAVATAGGVVVTELTVKAVRELFEAEEMLDGLACRLAAQRGSEEQTAKLEKIMLEEEDAAAHGDCLRLMNADKQLHEHIALMADNQTLLRFTHHVVSLLGRTRPISAHVPGRLMTIARENRQVVDAIKRHDGEEAEKSVREHVRSAERVVISILENVVVPFKGEPF